MKKSLLSLVAAAAISGAASGQAQAEEIVVHKGDTLWSLSKKYDVSVNSLKKWNNLSGDVIHPNDTLEVSPVKNVQVRKGDSLWNIAQSYGVKVEEIKSWNQLTSDIILPGMNLSIYTEMPAEMKVQAVNSAKPATANASAAAPAKPVSAPKAEVKQPAPAASSNHITVEATAYTANCTGCSGTTKTGVNLKANPNAKVIAVDPSVIPLGTKVYVEGYGYATAEDTGGAIKGNKIDVFIPTQDGAISWGRRQVKLTIIN